MTHFMIIPVGEAQKRACAGLQTLGVNQSEAPEGLILNSIQFERGMAQPDQKLRFVLINTDPERHRHPVLELWLNLVRWSEPNMGL